MSSFLDEASFGKPILPTGWSWKWLDEVMEIRGGAQPPASTFVNEPAAGYVRFVQIRDFDTDGHTTYIKDSKKWRKCTKTDILIARYGASLGRILRGIEGAYNVALVKAEPNGIDQSFLYYLLRSHYFQAPIISAGDRSAQAGFNKRDLSVISVPIPPPCEQRAIASILGALDDKIELNRKVSATLEALARTLFKSWFVDFDPVRTRAEGRDPGLPPEIAALFPDSFEDSELGEIPKGWRVGSLSDIAVLNPETWSSSTRPNLIRYVDLSTVKWGRLEKPTVYEQSQAPSRAQRVLRPGDTIVGTVRPGNGSYGLVAEEGLTGSTGFAVLRPTKSKAIIYLAATSKDNIARLGHLADGGAYPAVRPEVVSATGIPITPDIVLQVFDAAVCPLLDRVGQAHRESRTLAALRDALLPKLISGEIRVTDAKSLVGQSA